MYEERKKEDETLKFSILFEFRHLLWSCGNQRWTIARYTNILLTLWHERVQFNEPIYRHCVTAGTLIIPQFFFRWTRPVSVTNLSFSLLTFANLIINDFRFHWRFPTTRKTFSTEIHTVKLDFSILDGMYWNGFKAKKWVEMNIFYHEQKKKKKQIRLINQLLSLEFMSDFNITCHTPIAKCQVLFHHTIFRRNCVSRTFLLKFRPDVFVCAMQFTFIALKSAYSITWTLFSIQLLHFFFCVHATNKKRNTKKKHTP